MDQEHVRLTEPERKAQRRRSVAIALFLIAMVVIFYVVTVLRIGTGG